MKQLTLLFFAALTGLLLVGCSFTRSTGGPKDFAKRHYNRGIVRVQADIDRMDSPENTRDAREHETTVQLPTGSGTDQPATWSEALKNQVADVSSVNEVTPYLASVESIEAPTDEAPLAERFAFVQRLIDATHDNLELARSSEDLTRRQSRRLDRMDKALERLEAWTSNAQQQTYGEDETAKRRGLISLILGATSFVLFGLILGIPAVILGKKAMQSSDQNSQAYRFGRIGRILGWVSIGFGLFIFLFAILLPLLIII